MRRCVIFGGAEIGRYDAVRKALCPDDFLICCDSGLMHAEELKLVPDLVVGDFDSHENPHLSVETIILPREKDDTDTAYAVKEALRRGFTDFLLCGVIGQRMDHTLVNVSLLLRLSKEAEHAVILDDYEEISLLPAGERAVIEDCYPYFSLLSFDGPAYGVTITGAKYSLSDAMITACDPYATSNEVLPGQTACVTVKKGSLLLIKILEKD